MTSSKVQCHSVPFQDSVNNISARAKVVNISSYLFIITKPSLQFLICTRSYKACERIIMSLIFCTLVPETCNGAVLYIGLLLWQHYMSSSMLYQPHLSAYHGTAKGHLKFQQTSSQLTLLHVEIICLCMRWKHINVLVKITLVHNGTVCVWIVFAIMA